MDEWKNIFCGNNAANVVDRAGFFLNKLIKYVEMLIELELNK